MKLFLKILVCVVLMVIILSKVDLHEVLKLVTSVTWAPLALAFLTGIGDRFLVTWRWQILIHSHHHKISYRQTLGVMFVSGFLGSFLPSGVGIDAVRIWLMNRYGVSMSETVATTLVDRMAGLFALLLLTLGALIYLAFTFIEIPIIIICVTVFCLIIFVVMALSVRLGWLRHWLARYSERWKFLKKLETCAQALHVQGQNINILCKVLLLSFAVQGTRILNFYLLGMAIGTSIHIGWFCLLMPPIILITFIPISIGGLGTREAAFIYFFSLVGMQTAEAFTISILSHVMVVVSGALTGGYFFMVGDIPMRKVKHDLVLTKLQR